MSSATILTDSMLKMDVKSALGMTRVPRQLTMAHYFLWCYRQATTTGTIDRSLRTPSTVIIRERIGENHQSVIDLYFNTFCVFKDKSWSYTTGKQRTMSEWTEVAHDLFSRWADVQIPEETERLFYRQTREAATNLPSTIDGSLRKFYHSTSSSPYRWYHPAQSTPKADQPIVFKGCLNVDIVSCFTSIWWHEMGGMDCELDNAWLLHPDHKDEFYRLLMRDFNLSTPEEAKTLRTTLTSDYRNHHKVSSGVEWFDALHDRILTDAKMWAYENIGQHINAHITFTYVEQRIINRLLQHGDEMLLMHDGIIFKSADKASLVAAALPHKLTIKDWK